MRLIDADALKVNVARMSGDGDYVESVWYDIDRAQTVDVPDIKVGKWLPLKKGDKGYSAGDFRCSVCGEPNHTWIPRPNYCQNCGAKMQQMEVKKNDKTDD